MGVRIWTRVVCFAVHSSMGKVDDLTVVRHDGSEVESVDSRAMTEIGFQDEVLLMPAEEFFEAYEPVDERTLTAEAEGDEGRGGAGVVAPLEEQIEALRAGWLRDVLRSERAKGHLKMRDRTHTRSSTIENRPHFQ